MAELLTTADQVLEALGDRTLMDLTTAQMDEVGRASKRGSYTQAIVALRESSADIWVVMIPAIHQLLPKQVDDSAMRQQWTIRDWQTISQHLRGLEAKEEDPPEGGS